MLPLTEGDGLLLAAAELLGVEELDGVALAALLGEGVPLGVKLGEGGTMTSLGTQPMATSDRTAWPVGAV